MGRLARDSISVGVTGLGSCDVQETKRGTCKIGPSSPSEGVYTGTYYTTRSLRQCQGMTTWTLCML